MGFMGEISENIGWNNCINYLLENIDKFESNLVTLGIYDYFPSDEIKETFIERFYPNYVDFEIEERSVNE